MTYVYRKLEHEATLAPMITSILSNQHLKQSKPMKKRGSNQATLQFDPSHLTNLVVGINELKLLNSCAVSVGMDEPP